MLVLSVFSIYTIKSVVWLIFLSTPVNSELINKMNIIHLSFSQHYAVRSYFWASDQCRSGSAHNSSFQKSRRLPRARHAIRSYFWTSDQCIRFAAHNFPQAIILPPRPLYQPPHPIILPVRPLITQLSKKTDASREPATLSAHTFGQAINVVRDPLITSHKRSYFPCVRSISLRIRSYSPYDRS